jgi:hypothetical protein
MNLRTTLLVPLVIAATACGRQDAAPFVAPDPAAQARGTATIRIVVMRDTATSRTAARFAPAGNTAANGQTRVNLYRASDPNGSVVKTGLTTATGEIVFSGLPPGDYVVKPVLRSQSTTLVPAAGIPVRVAAGSIVAVDTLRVRLSTRISGMLATEWFDQVTQRRIRHAGVKIRIHRETGSGTGVYAVVDSVTTNAIGNFDYFTTPGPERVRLTFNSNDITNFKDSTTFQGAAPIPYVKKEETITITGITPGRDITQNLIFNYPTRITGFLYRDRNNNSFRDSVVATSTKEGLVAGDTITVQLRDSTGSRVITTTRIIATASTTFTGAAPTYTFSSVAPGKYVIRMDRLASRFGSNPLEFFEGPTYTVIVPELAPSASAVTISQNFGLRSGQ